MSPQILAALLLSSGMAYAAGPMEITVAPGESLAAARDALRTKRQAGEKGPAVIIVSGQRHEIDAPLALDARDSDLTLRAAEGTRPVLTGGSVVRDFKHYRGSILRADVSGIAKPGAKLRQLLFGGERMTLARYPNADAKDPLFSGWAFVDAFPGTGAAKDHDWKSTLLLKPGDLRLWEHPEDVEIDIFPQYGWWNDILPVRSIDPGKRLLTLARPCDYDLHPHNRFRFQNALEELDAPGEWFLDPRERLLYFWPPGPLADNEVRLVTLDGFIDLKPGAKNIRIEGLSFSACNGSAIELEDTVDCLVAACSISTVSYFNGSAISIVGGSGNSACGNDIILAGATGIRLGGGDRVTLRLAENRASNNHIQRFGLFNKNASGISVSGTGQRIDHNLIHDGPRMGIQLSGNRHIVEYNHLHHLCLETQDGAAIYTGGRDWLGGRGSAWRYNRIHDILGCGQTPEGLKRPWFTFGLYPDDNAGGIDIVGNLVYRVAHAPLHLHNSRDCLVENNVFAYGGAYQFDLHGWKGGDRLRGTYLPAMIQAYESVAGRPEWKGMRGMELHPKDAVREDGTLMNGNMLRRNIMLSGRPESRYADVRHASSKWNTIDGNLAWNTAGPVTVGLDTAGPDKGEPLLAEGFDVVAETGGPVGWNLSAQSTPRASLSMSQGKLLADPSQCDPTGKLRVLIDGPDLPLKPGATYRLRAKVKGAGVAGNVGLSLALYKKGAGYWQSKAPALGVSNEWQEMEAIATVPMPGQPDWQPWMAGGWLRIDWRDGKGSLALDEVRVNEVHPRDDWASWQASGWDGSSHIADPLFLDPEKDDFRLHPASPAIGKLGFKPLPLEKMGLIADEWRSTVP